jgi:TM2 domain-containing membrane protein YozV
MPATADRQPAVWAAPVAGVLGWLVPGLGHLYLGQRARGLVCLVAITATFWTGVAIGSVHATVDPRERTLWFLAQLCTGGNTLIAYGWHAALTPPHNRDPHGASAHDHARTTVPHWLSVDVGVHYTGVAGLLNLLVILDALARAELMAPVGLRNSRVRKKGYP